MIGLRSSIRRRFVRFRGLFRMFFEALKKYEKGIRMLGGLKVGGEEM